MSSGDYEWFITLAELEHVTASAEQLQMAQPTLTRMLARLEKQMGTPLFERRGKRLALNSYGRIFYQHARRAQYELDSARRAIEDLNNPAVSEIRLGFLHSFGSALIPTLISRFVDVSPRVSFALTEGAAGGLYRAVEDDTIDVAVVSPRPRSSALAWRSIFRQQLGVAVPQGHRLANLPAVSMSDLADEHFVAMHPGYGMRRLLNGLCSAAHFQPHVSYEVENLTTTAGLVSAGLGVGILPIDGYVYSPEVVMVPLADSDAYRDVGLIWRAVRPLPGSVRDFISVAATFAIPAPEAGGI